MPSSTTRTRMAPSPTGDLHVGGLAMALKNYAWAKRNQGQFILRIEDTDKDRQVDGAIEQIQEILKLFGLQWDEGPGVGGPNGPYIQSERLELYQQKAAELIKNDHAYYCFCSKDRLAKVREQMRAKNQPPKYDQHCRKIDPSKAKKRVESGEDQVIRLKVPADQDLTFTDLIRGEITFNSDSVDDQILIKTDGFPTYHLAVVVDDHDMEISHVFRGEEWISSTPKHILLYQAFNWQPPTFCHFPVFLNPDGQGKMSKRKGSVSVQSFLDRGYLPQALLNFLMILGWAPADENEIISLDRYIKEFNPADVSAKSVIFDLKKLDWINGQYIRELSNQELTKKLEPFLPSDFPEDKLGQIVPLVKDRLTTLNDIESLTSFFYQQISYDNKLLLIRDAEPDLVKLQLKETKAALKNTDDWQTQTVETTIRNLQEKHDWHRGQYFMMLRIAATGKKATPPLFETLAVIGKKVVLKRLEVAQEKL